MLYSLQPQHLAIIQETPGRFFDVSIYKYLGQPDQETLSKHIVRFLHRMQGYRIHYPDQADVPVQRG
jgi:hypothetical protein